MRALVHLLAFVGHFGPLVHSVVHVDRTEAVEDVLVGQELVTILWALEIPGRGVPAERVSISMKSNCGDVEWRLT